MFKSFPSHQDPLKTIGLGMVIVIGMVGINLLQIPQINHLKMKNQDYSSPSFKQDLDIKKANLQLMLKSPSFGFNNLVSDVIFLDFVGYLGDDEARKVSGYGMSFDYFQVMVDKDPKFREMYLFLSNTLTIYAGMPLESVALMEKGLKSLSPTVPKKSYYVWRLKGIDELLFLGNPQKAQKSFETAAEWASVYPDQQSQEIAQRSKQTALFLANNPNSKFAQFNAWVMILQNAFDDEVRKKAIQKIEGLGGKVMINSDGSYNIQPPAED